MKKIFRLFALLIICLCALHDVFGQKSTDRYKELSDLEIKAQQLRANRSYRMKMTREVYDEKGTTLKTKYIFIREVVPPDRYYLSSATEANGVTKKNEFIDLGEKKFVRKDEGKWEVYNPEMVQSEDTIVVAAVKNIELLEETTFNGQPVKVFVKQISFSSEGLDTTTKYWFTTEGELLKTEAEKKNRKTNEITREVTLYEYDADIKIEAPIK